MRIIGTIPNPYCRIQVFQNDGRLSVKIEKGLLEQLFKLRESAMITSFEDVQKLIDDSFIQKILAVFELMQANINASIEANIIAKNSDSDSNNNHDNWEAII